MIWIALLFVLVGTNIFLLLGTFWFVYGIWPQSWLMFWGFGLLTYLQSEAAKFVGKKMLQEWKDKV